MSQPPFQPQSPDPNQPQWPYQPSSFYNNQPQGYPQPQQQGYPQYQQPPQYPPVYQTGSMQPGSAAPPTKPTLWRRYKTQSKGMQIFIGCGMLFLAFLLCSICSGIAAAANGSQTQATATNQQATPTIAVQRQATQAIHAVVAQPTPKPQIQPTPVPTPSPQLAYELASIDNPGIAQDDPAVATYQNLLDKLHKRTGDSEQQIADQTVAGQQILRSKGQDAKLLELMQGVDTALASTTNTTMPIHYSEALAALITLMTTPQN